jgi:hypothetical protein
MEMRVTIGVPRQGQTVVDTAIYAIASHHR